MSAIDRIGSTASLYIRQRPQDVSQAVPDPTPERSASLIGGGAAQRYDLIHKCGFQETCQIPAGQIIA
ncbi:hypothetical protein [Agrobacterium tumefaciens]|uniref:hypothetical protein n=1 Tax=Agrobacterium tumefaciens TaxID=358 RepID=UPI003BA130CE